MFALLGGILGFVFDTITFFRWVYVVLCILVGIGVVFVFCRNVWRTILYKKRRAEEMKLLDELVEYEQLDELAEYKRLAEYNGLDELP